jgi:DNA repair exonuclease SbcCD ATPase subunit
MPEKKTEDMKAYQKQYRETHPKSKEAQSAYMKKYIADSVSIDCPICGGKFHTYSKYKHDKSQKHLRALIEIKDKEEKAKLKKEEEELQAKALEQAQIKRDQPIPPRKKKTQEKSKPAPRKKKEEEKVEEKPKEKHASLKALEEYESSSEEEEEDENDLKKETFKFQPKKIKNEEVNEYIKKHFEESVNPNRPVNSKVKRLNKDASLWKKVSEELEGKTWKYVGQNFGKIVSKAYPKPNSQAELISLLKRLVMHFSKLTAKEEKRLNDLARKLKGGYVKEQT